MHDMGHTQRAINNFLNGHVAVLMVWFALAIVVGLYASARGRHLPIWFAIALFISPLIAGIIVAVLPRSGTD